MHGLSSVVHGLRDSANENPQHRLGRLERQSGVDLFSTSFPREVVEPIRAGDLAC